MSTTPQQIFSIAPELTSGTQQVQTITFSASLVTGNLITGSVGGSSFSVPFNTDNATTMADLATAIGGNMRVDSCVVTSSSVLTVTTLAVGISLIIVGPTVTGGASQATAAVLQTQAPYPGATTLAQVNAAIVAAASMMNACVWGGFYDIGQTYLAAHLLSLGTLKGKTGVNNEKVGDLSRGYMQQTAPKGVDQVYFMTAYGMQYIALRNMLAMTPLNTGYSSIPSSPALYPMIIP